MKKLLAVGLILALCLTCVSATAEQDGDFSYYVKDGSTAKLTGYTGASDVAVIPEKLGGCPVTEISDYAFYENAALTSVTIPEGVTRIGESAFAGCTALTEIILPESLTTIGKSAFSACTALTEVALPDGVKLIDVNPFSGCQNLKNIIISDEHPALEIVDGALYSKEDKRLICCPAAREGETYAIAEGTLIIGASAFCGCQSLTGIDIPDSVWAIGTSAFSGSGLTEITIPDSVTLMMPEVFERCESLVSVTLPGGLTEIPDFLFEGCTSLAEVVIPGSVSMIKPWTFGDCVGLTGVILKEGVTMLMESAFAYCVNLTDVTIPASVTMMGGVDAMMLEISPPEELAGIGEWVFPGCDSLTVTVVRDSFAEQYCKIFGLNYQYAE